jgi:hypothetical protein
MAAKYYIYRNLNRGGFSIKHKGLVVDRVNTFEAENVEFRVSGASRNRARREQSRNVHAYIVCERYSRPHYPDIEGMQQVYYHPLITDNFVLANTTTPIHEASRVVGICGKAYIQP